VYILGQECFGKDGEAFLNALKGSEPEKAALRAVLALNVPIVSDQNQAGKVISELWEPHAKLMLSAVSDQATADSVLGMRDLTPGQMLAEACRVVREREVLQSFPVYSQLGPVGQLADGLARSYRTGGAATMLRLVERTEKDHLRRAICYAFLEAVGEAQQRKWQFTKEERESGEHLAPHALEMTRAGGKDHHAAFLRLLLESGSGESAVRTP